VNFKKIKCTCLTYIQSDLVVSAKNGKIRGEYVSVKGTERRAKCYLGIPFAQPPVGDRRFSAPRPEEPWEGVRDGTQEPSMCIQDPELVVNVSKTMSLEFIPPAISEDCLYLNVYTPAEATKGNKLPVMVWIHGGGLAMGAASQYDGAPLAVYENIVMVIIQYRLGILGFLSTGDEHAQGNWGFLDQLAALRWVQENIEAFGGDPQTVTVAGESAGGISASILTLSPQAKGLFQRAIFQSGVATLGTYTTNHPLSQAQVLKFECEEFEVAHSDCSIITSVQMKIFLGAVVDGEFLTDLAEALLQKHEVLKVPVLMGITNHEFGWILPQSFAVPGWENGMNRETVLAASFVNNLIVDEYLQDAKTPEEIRDGFTEIIGDLLMTLPVVRVAGYHSDVGVPVYMYEFAYQAEIYKHNRPSFVKADHADDVGLMFGGCFWNGNIKILGKCGTYTDDLLCTDIPSSPNGPGLVSWPQYNRQNQEYMELGPTQTVKQKLRKDRVHFATVTLPLKLRELEAAAKLVPGN
uniref:Carboxylic ester hydrolase n=1 Tax=Pundamilia nyererei TaxID=303518 RepID=A0A3B4FEA0_9CICH